MYNGRILVSVKMIGGYQGEETFPGQLDFIDKGAQNKSSPSRPTFVLRL